MRHQRILAKAEGSTERGQIGAWLRREGLYASTLDKWRQQRARGTLGGEKRGPKVDAQLAKYPMGTMTMAQVMTWREYIDLRNSKIEEARDPSEREPSDEEMDGAGGE